MRPKRLRVVRTESGAFSPCERDFDILTLIGLCRFVSTDQIARACFPSLDRARRRVRAMFDAGLVDVRLTTSTAPNILSLTRRGIELLTVERPDLAARVRAPGVLRLAEVERHLAGVDLRLYAVAWGAATDQPLVRWSPRYGSLGEELGLPAGLEPDALAQFETAPEQSRFVAVEVAVTPQALRALRSRLDLYALAPPELAVWVVVRDREQAWADPALSERVVVLERAHVVARPVRPLPEWTGRRAVGPAATEPESGESPAASRRLRTESRR